MKSKFRRICSSVLAFVLCFCMTLPNMDLSVAKAEDTTYILNASEMTAGDITETTSFGYFSVSANAENKVTIDSNTKTGDNGIEFSQRLKLGGTGNLEYRNVFFTTKGAATITVQALSSSSSADRPLLLMGEDGTEIKRETAYGVVEDGAIRSLTYEVTEAGTYYLWSEASGINIYYIEVIEKAAPVATAGKTMSLNISDLADATITELTTLGEKGEFSTIASADKTVVIEGNKKTGDNGVEFTKRLKLGGTGSMELRNVSFTVSGAAKVTVYAMSSSSGADRNLLLVGEDGTTVGTGIAYGAPADGIIPAITYDIAAAGTYYIWSESSGINIYSIDVVEAGGAVAAGPMILNVSELADATITELTALGEKGEFSTIASADKTVVIENNAKTGDNGMEFTKRLKLGGTGSIDLRNVSFTVSGAAKVTVYAMSSSSGADRNLLLVGEDGTTVGTGIAYGAPADGIIPAITYDIANAGTYYMWSESSGINIYYIEVVQEGGAAPAEPERAAWNTVTAPVLGTPEISGGTIKVPYTMLIGPSTDGCDRLYVYMYDAAGAELEKVTVAKASTEGYAEFTPTASGDYSFKADAARTDEETVIASNAVEHKGFMLPLEAPYVASATSQGNGKVSLVWSEVPEAEKYLVSYAVAGTGEFKEAGTIDSTTAILSGLTVGTRYVFEVKAMRGDDLSPAGSLEATATAESQRVWSFAAFGEGVNTTDNYYTGNINDGSVTIASINGKGKIVPATTDGLAFYYTEIDAAKENFVLEGTIHVDSWTLSNGQDGFGIMAADTIGIHGDASKFWNNSYMGIMSKVEYKYDPETMQLLDIKAEGTKISMKLGIGAQEKIGATAENIADDTITTNVNELFKSTMYTLETSRIGYTAGTYNIVGNYTNSTAPSGTSLTPLTEFKFRLVRDNTGYTVTYIDQYGEEHSQLFYDTERTNLTQIDKDKIYVGFFASRNATITVTDVSLTTSDPSKDAAAAERELTKKALVSKFVSATKTGDPDYEVIYYANANGTVKITNTRTNEVVADNVKVTADTYNYFNSKLEKGYNSFSIEFTPDADFRFGEYEVLESYETEKEPFGVTHKTIGTETAIYVTNLADSTGKGTKNSPVDIATALSYAVAGQTIILGGGEYLMESTLTVERGNDGTADKMIYLIADPDATERPVLNFQKLYRGIVFAGDYWYIAGFDVTNTKNVEKGIQLSGDYCTLDSCNTYNNGNTGIQISRYTSEDYYKDWPSHNLVLNCTSYNNADLGYEDADGFAAKLTIGDGNVFDGCIAYNNADDGWDLFAKIESGPIGKVVIKNCVTYGNGYLMDGTVAGNGNGFKLGGSSISGYHELINCIAFNNKAKGIDSNSCPDIQVTNCVSFNNGGANVALYTNDAVNTDYKIDGLISFRTDKKDVAENIKPKGTQDTAKIYGTNNYYWSGAGSTNTVGVAVPADWFQSLEFDASKGFTRNEDGTINLGGFLEMSDKAPVNVGSRITGVGQASAELDKVKEERVVEVEATPTPTPTKAPETTQTPAPTQGADEPSEPTDSEGGINPVVIVIIVAIVVVAAAAIVGLILFSKKKKNS